jgi:hypothetical protein
VNKQGRIESRAFLSASQIAAAAAATAVPSTSFASDNAAYQLIRRLTTANTARVYNSIESPS